MDKKSLKNLLIEIRTQSEKIGYLRRKIETTAMHETKSLIHLSEMLLQANKKRKQAFDQIKTILDND